MASLTGNLVAETYKALLKTIDNDILTASEKQITDGLGGGSNVFIDSNGFLRANKYKVTNGLATQFLKADGSLDANAYLTSITGAQVITALGYTPVTNARTLTINGTTYDLTANRSWTVAGTAAVWGNITGTLSNQTDLQTALNAKFNNPTGTISQYIRGDGSLATFPTLPGGLPIGGTAGQILAKIDATDYNTHWIDNFATQTKNEVKLGQTLAKGTAVYVSSANGTNMIVSAASNASENLSSKTFGLLETGGATNDFVKCVTFGLIAGLDTSTATAGDPVWLGVNGALLFGVANKPVAPANMVYIGVVTRVQSNNGEIFVNVQNGFEIEELHDVLITSKANNQGLFYESSTGLWKNKSIATVLGYTPQAQLNGTGFVKASGTTISYDNSTYLTTADAASTYQRLDRMAINLLASDIQYPNNNAVIAALALKANAANPVFTGNMTISGAEPKLFFTDTDNNPDYTVFIDSGVFYIYDQTAGTTRFSISSTGNISAGVGKSITAGSFVKESGLATQFLKADGSIDSSTYVTSTALADYLLITTAASTYQRLDRIASSLFASATNYPNNNAVIAGLALKADAANPVFTGSMNIQGLESRINFYDENNLRKFFIGYSSGQLSIYQDAGSATRFQINSSGNITTGVNNTITSWGFIRSGGTSSQYLMADGSVSTLTNPVTGTGTTNYLPKFTGASTIGNSTIFDNGTSVGIGTATPTDKLDISGVLRVVFPNDPLTGAITAKILSFSPNPYGLIFRGYASGTHSIQSQRESNNAQLFGLSLQPEGGNVLIGTLTDSGIKLDVNGTGRFSGNLSGTSVNFTSGNFSSTVTTTKVQINGGTTTEFVLGLNSNSTFAFGSTNGRRAAIFAHETIGDSGLQFGWDTTDKTGIIAGSANVTGAGIDFYTFNGSSWANRARITKDGNLGIGTNAPTGTYGKLSVAGGISLLNDNSGKLEIGRYSPGYSNSYIKLGSSSNALNITDNADQFDIFTILNSGSVGINITDPVNTAWGNGSVTKQLSINATNYAVINLLGGSRRYSMGVGDNNFYMAYDNSQSRHNIIVYGSGNIGINGAADAGYKLDVTGTIRSTGINYAANFYAGGTYNAPNAVVIASDLNWTFGCFNSGAQYWMQVKYYGVDDDSRGFRLLNMNNGTVDFRVNGLGNGIFRGSVTATSFFESSDFRLKKLIEHNPIVAGIDNLQAKLYEKNGKLELGYFAQDAEKIMPYAVTKNADGFLNLSYREVHTAKIARLEQRVAELEKQLNAA